MSKPELDQKTLEYIYKWLEKAPMTVVDYPHFVIKDGKSSQEPIFFQQHVYLADGVLSDFKLEFLKDSKKKN